MVRDLPEIHHVMEDIVLTKETIDDHNTAFFLAEVEKPHLITYGNKRFYQIFGDSKERFKEVYQSNLMLAFPFDKRPLYTEQISQKMRGFDCCVMDVELELESSMVPYYMNLQKILMKGKLLYLGILVPISHHKEVVTQLLMERKYFLALQELTQNEMFRIDLNTWTFYNKNYNVEKSNIPEELVNFPEYILEKQLIHPFDIENFQKALEKISKGMSLSTILRFRVTPDDFTWFQIDAKPIFDEDGCVVEVIGRLKNVNKDIEIKERAFNDPLTGALNKEAFKESVENTIKGNRHSEGCILFFLDVDDFKYVNDNLGHDFGDFLLKLFSQRLRHSLRDYDLVGRVGGDEFTILIKGLTDEEILHRKAKTILDNVRREYANSEHRHVIKASIGISRFPMDGDSYEELYKKADLALYESKKRGKDVATIYKIEESS